VKEVIAPPDAVTEAQLPDAQLTVTAFDTAVSDWQFWIVGKPPVAFTPFAAAVRTPAPAPVIPERRTAAAVIEELQPNPAPLVHFNALAAVLHEGTARSDGVVAVKAPRTVFAV
jgi:cell division septation protein DedD